MGKLTQTECGSIDMNNDHRYQYQYHDINDMRKHTSALMDNTLQKWKKPCIYKYFNDVAGSINRTY